MISATHDSAASTSAARLDGRTIRLTLPSALAAAIART
jgi:hypothetical protein